jgi:hypothetical protein
VRGDSVRDLYAKTLAVCGLGLLAGAGALVDYWPVRGDVPAVSPVASLQPAVRVLAADLTRVIPAPPPVRVAIARPAPVPAALPVHDGSYDVVLMAATDASLEFAGLGDWPPPAPEPLPVFVELPLPVVETEPIALAPSPWSAGGTESAGFFSEAVRLTRESIKDARASLRGAFRGMVGVFKRVPFFSTAHPTAPSPL